MKFSTLSGSCYEANIDSKKIRRLNGAKDPTVRQGKDGDWRAYKELLPSPLRKGTCALIVWEDDTELLASGKEYVKTGGVAIPTTMTSVVVSIEE